MNAVKHLLKTTSLTILVIGSMWFIMAPSPTLAAEDHYKIPGWVCKPSGRIIKYPSSSQVMYDRLRARVFNNHPSTFQTIICPLHIKEGISRIKKVLVYYTDNNRERSVQCTLDVIGRKFDEAHERAESPSGSGQGFLSISTDFSFTDEIYYLECNLPWKTALGTSSIDNIHVYQKKTESTCSGTFGACFDQAGVGLANMPGVACHPLSERLGIQYYNTGTDGSLRNVHRSRPLQVVCPIVRDNTKTKKSPSIAVEMHNKNPRSRFRASCTMWVTGSSQGRSIRMRWKGPTNGGLGKFQTIRSVTINSDDTFSVICSIPPTGGGSGRSGITRVTYSE